MSGCANKTALLACNAYVANANKVLSFNCVFTQFRHQLVRGQCICADIQTSCRRAQSFCRANRRVSPRDERSSS